MAQAGFTPISLYFSSTAAAVPTAVNLANGELAINIQDEKLYFKNAAGTVKLLASNATSAPVLSFSAGTTGLTPNTATTGAVTLAGTLAVANGGTGVTTSTGTTNVVLSNSPTLVTPTLGVATATSLQGIIGNVTPAAGSFTTLSASSTLSVTGAGSIEGITVGRGAGAVASNTAVGASALAANTSGKDGVALGNLALRDNTSGIANIAIGSLAMITNTTGSYNTAIGSGEDGFTQGALGLNTTGSSNTGVGYQALRFNTTASYNTAVGYQAGYNNTTGQFNALLGYQAGYRVAGAGSIGDGSVLIGYRAGYASQGNNNVGIGNGALTTNTTGTFNVAVGTSALELNTTASNNTAVGYETLDKVTTGTQNVGLGTGAGSSGTNDLTTGSNNILIGYNAAASSASVSNENTFGNSSTTSNRFWGDFKMGGSSAGTSGEVLTSQGSGAAPTWASPAGGGSMIFISTVTASGATTVDIETTFDSTYDQYVIYAPAFTLSGNPTNGELKMRLKIGGTYPSASGYMYASNTTTAGTYAGLASSNNDAIYLTNQLSDSPSFPNAVMNLVIYVSKPSTTNRYKTVMWQGSQTFGNNPNTMNGVGWYSSSTAALTGVRLLFAGGATFSGSFRLYGIKNS